MYGSDPYRDAFDNPTDDPGTTGGAPAGRSAPTFDQVNADYQKYLNRSLSQAEYQQYWASRTDYDPSMVFNSKEGIDYLNKTHPEFSGAPAAAAAPATTTGPGVGAPSTATGSLVAPFTEKFGAPAPVNLGGPAGIPYIPQTPSLTPPNFPNIPRFHAPSVEEALASPGYKFTLQQGENELQNWAAAKGTLNDSSTAKSLIDYGQAAGSREYQNVWNRDFNAYNSDVQTQYLDPFAAAYQGWMAGTVNPTMTAYSTQAAAGQHQNDLNYANGWNQWLQDWNIFRDQRDSTFTKQFQVATA